MGHNTEACQHGHTHAHHSLSGKKMGIAIFLNLLITVLQFLGGIVSGSVALLSDALHNFSDVVSLLLSFVSNRLAKKKETSKETYGYKRAEILSAFINSLSLIAIALFLVYEAIERLLNPQEVLSDWVIYFALASIVVNFISVLILSSDAKENMNIKSAYLHLLTDVMTSVAVLIGGILMKYFSIYKIDSILSILIAIYLIFSTYKLLVASTKILMQFTPKNTNIKKIATEINQIENIKNVHHVHIWQLNERELFFESHIDLKNDIPVSGFQEILLPFSRIPCHAQQMRYTACLKINCSLQEARLYNQYDFCRF